MQTYPEYLNLHVLRAGKVCIYRLTLRAHTNVSLSSAQLPTSFQQLPPFCNHTNFYDLNVRLVRSLDNHCILVAGEYVLS